MIDFVNKYARVPRISDFGGEIPTTADIERIASVIGEGLDDIKKKIHVHNLTGAVYPAPCKVDDIRREMVCERSVF